MDFLSAVRVVLRRWPVVLAALVLSLAAAYLASQSVAPAYQAKGSALLVGPQGNDPLTEEPLPDNPYTRLDNSTLVLTAVAVQIMDDSSIRESLRDQGADPEYVVGRAEDGTPVLGVVATNSDPAVALKTVSLVLDRLNDELADRQAEAGAPEKSWVRSIVVTEPDEATEQLGGRIRAFLAVAALGVAASISLAFITEAIAQGRRRRSTDLASAAPSAAPSASTTASTAVAAAPAASPAPAQPSGTSSATASGKSASKSSKSSKASKASTASPPSDEVAENGETDEASSTDSAAVNPAPAVVGTKAGSGVPAAAGTPWRPGRRKD